VPYTDALIPPFLLAYRLAPFPIALGASVVGMFLGALLEFLARLFIPSMREYPETPGTGLTGQITEGTAEIMAKAHLESALYAPDGGAPGGKGYDMEDAFLSGRRRLPPVEPNVQVQKL